MFSFILQNQKIWSYNYHMVQSVLDETFWPNVYFGLMYIFCPEECSKWPWKEAALSGWSDSVRYNCLCDISIFFVFLLISFLVESRALTFPAVSLKLLFIQLYLFLLHLGVLYWVSVCSYVILHTGHFITEYSLFLCPSLF